VTHRHAQTIVLTMACACLASAFADLSFLALVASYSVAHKIAQAMDIALKANACAREDSEAAHVFHRRHRRWCASSLRVQSPRNQRLLRCILLLRPRSCNCNSPSRGSRTRALVQQRAASKACASRELVCATMATRVAIVQLFPSAAVMVD
jgi:hypothetical protein